MESVSCRFIIGMGLQARCTCAVASIGALVLGQIIVQILPAASEGEALTLFRRSVVMPARERTTTRPDLLWSHAVIWWETTKDGIRITLRAVFRNKMGHLDLWSRMINMFVTIRNWTDFVHKFLQSETHYRSKVCVCVFEWKTLFFIKSMRFGV